ncbi:ankyrin repeat and SOCS box protein 18 isoform X2 [Protopterus annectens]|uniref:ankyrin repeat and SOCS box protein 18 isoform X2 n=1 Tax=Protopterus annectens TaxID=7888 RepID=UPI001CFB12B7|nr:ankyrin repeat and SOCS box protein 18 isoform X2 [Protopterus annectens]
MLRAKSCGLDHIPDYPLESKFVKKLKSALEVDDVDGTVHMLCDGIKHVNATIELSNDDWMKDPSVQLHPLVLVGLWSLEYKRELTNPLCITASRGYKDCLRYLLENRAHVNAAPGGKAALHHACENAHTDCVELLLDHGANPNLLTEDGLAPLHLCTTHKSFRCAKLLLKYGAVVDQPSQDDQETPLHIAAKHGLHNHAHLYLRYGAAVNSRNSLDETPLIIACANAQKLEDMENFLDICRIMLIYEADVNATDEEQKSPLHKACKNACYDIVSLLLEYQADVNVIDYNGSLPLTCVLQNAVLKQDLKPYRTAQCLLNHGCQRLWPTSFLKVLKSCAAAPKTIEILFNSYPQIKVTDKWVEAVPEEIYQMHEPFYKSLFMLASTPRSLQHFCRSVIRNQLQSQCHSLIPQLPVPKFLIKYLLLEPEGIVF